MSDPITIVGGGLAGLTLGIGLRQRGVPVRIWEAGNYPRHRVCGEFISGGGQASLTRLGLLDGLKKAGAHTALTAAFFDTAAPKGVRALPAPALCLSRWALDAWLAEEFQRLGGELRVNSRWTDPYSAGVVRASGRRAVPLNEGWRWFGLKVHAHGVELAADLELHLVPSGYVGMCRLNADEVNLCGLFRSAAPIPDLAETWRTWLSGHPNSPLHNRLRHAKLDGASFCSVAGLFLSPQRATDQAECSIGDALTMIPPVTGNGMSMAFESAEIAIGPLVGYNQGNLSWQHTRAKIARNCDERFASRLRWAGRLQRALFQPYTRALLFSLSSYSAWFWRRVFQSTR